LRTLGWSRPGGRAADRGPLRRRRCQRHGGNAEFGDFVVFCIVLCSARWPPSGCCTFAAPAPPPNRPPQGNCPPACTQIPDSAWIASPSIPLYNDDSWLPLAHLSKPVSSPRFEADEICAAGPVADDERHGALGGSDRRTLFLVINVSDSLDILGAESLQGVDRWNWFPLAEPGG
jgi:hypothetical protein